MNDMKQRLLGFIRGRNFASGVLVAIIVAIAVFVNAIAYTLVSGLGLYFTFDSGEPLSITDSASDTFEKALSEGKKIEIIFCMYEDDVKEHDTGKLVYKTAKLLEEKYPEFIKLKYVNAITRLDSTGKPFNFDDFAENHVGGDTITNYFNTTSVIINCIKTDGMGNVDNDFRVLTDKTTGSGFGDFYSINADYEADSFNGEEVFTAMCSWVIRDDDERKNAYVTVGHGETPDVTLYNALLCAGYYIKEVDLKKAAGVPENADLVIISNPKNDIEKAAKDTVYAEFNKLVEYRDRGGNFFIMMDPYAKKLPVLTEFVSEFGISPKLTADGNTQLIKDTRQAITNDGFTIVADYADEGNAPKMKEAAGLSETAVIIREASPLSLSGNASALLVSSASSVCQASGETTDREGSYAIAAYSTKEKDGKTASIFFTSSVYLLANDAMISDDYTNKDFLYSVFDVIFDGGDMPYGCTPVVYDTGVLENLTLGTKILYTAIIMAVPTAILALGVFVVVRRRNR